MTGMKEGAGENPFADETDGSGGTEPSDGTDRSAPADGSGDSGAARPVRIPYKFRRDGVQDGRRRVPLFLHQETKDGEREARRELEDRFDDDVSLTDLREALVMVGLDHLDEAEAQLEEWGYGMTFE